jgi:hypothetical protein
MLKVHSPHGYPHHTEQGAGRCFCIKGFPLSINVPFVLGPARTMLGQLQLAASAEQPSARQMINTD